jgi:glutamate 5-kinase
MMSAVPQPLVVKLGSSTLVDPAGRVRRARLARIGSEIASLRSAGEAVCVVSSGAIALGLGVLGRRTRARDVPRLQAASAIGQARVVAAWQQALAPSRARAAQVLLTAADLQARSTYLNARATLQRLLEWDVVPVVNENDSTATDEITFGDNDALAAQVAVLLRARLLVLLTDADGLFDRDPAQPGARLIERVDDHRLLHELDTSSAPGSAWGSGGMRSKVVAAEMASAGGVETVIASGARERVLVDAAGGGRVGTRFGAHPRRVPAFKLWLRYGKPVSGSLVVDAGARRALERDGASLLPVGVTAVQGRFRAGDAVTVKDAAGEVFATGLAASDAAAITRALGRRSDESGLVEAVHRDYLVLHGDRRLP